MKLNREYILYKKYGDYNLDGYFILDHEKWDYYASNIKKYRKEKLNAWLCLILIPIAGLPITEYIYNRLGLTIF